MGELKGRVESNGKRGGRRLAEGDRTGILGGGCGEHSGLFVAIIGYGIRMGE